MTRFLSLIFLFFILGGLIALGFNAGSGFVLFRYGHYEVQTSLIFFVIAIILIAIIVYVILRLLVGGWRLPGRLGKWLRGKGHRRARESLLSGLMALREGRWNEAEKQLTRHADQSEKPVLSYLSAAQAAHARRAWERRDEHLRKAYRSESGASIATLLTQASLEMDQGQYARAQATLKRLGEVAKTQPRALALQARLYRHLEDWEQLRALLPRLEQRGALARDEREDLQRELYQHLLAADSVRTDGKRLREIWETVPGNLRNEADLATRYAYLLAEAGETDAAASVASGFLGKSWNPDLARLYGRLAAGDSSRQLGNAEQWLKRYGEKPELLLMAGAVCLRNRLWGRARTYLQKSLDTLPTAEGYMAMGDLCHEMGDEQEACRAYRNGAKLSLSDT